MWLQLFSLTCWLLLLLNLENQTLICEASNIFPQSSRGIKGQFTWHNGAINSVQSAINIGPNWHLKDLELRNCTLGYFYIGKLEKEPHSSSTVLGFKSIIPHFIFIGYMIGLQQFWILTLFNSITDQFHNCKGTKKDPNLKLLGVKDPTTTPSNGHSGQWTCIWWTWWTWWTWISNMTFTSHVPPSMSPIYNSQTFLIQFGLVKLVELHHQNKSHWPNDDDDYHDHQDVLSQIRQLDYLLSKAQDIKIADRWSLSF